MLLIFISSCTIKGKQQIYCDDFYDKDDCICPEGQKKIGTPIGSRCFDESFCEHYTLSDNQSVCVEECPPGYLSDMCTGCMTHTCINVKEINEGNSWRYGVDILRTSKLSLDYKDCRITDYFILEDKYELIIECYNLQGNCSLYIYNDTTYEFGDCPNYK